MFVQFFNTFWHYFLEVLPFLIIGFLISGLVHEFVSTEWVGKRLGKKGIKPIFYAALVGTVLPVCCEGSLPVAVSFYQKGARLGAILAFLVATPATSIPALLITYKLLGLQFALFLSLAVILLSLIIGLIGNLFSSRLKIPEEIKEACEECGQNKEGCACSTEFISRIKHSLKFAFWEMPFSRRGVGKYILFGLVLAALVITIVPGDLIGTYLSGAGGYITAVIFGSVIPICATGSVPLVHALLFQGINIGAAFTLLLVGPITSFGAIFTLRKVFGSKILLIYLAVVLAGALLAGLIFSLL